MRRFVQFPHPGGEAGPDRSRWLRADSEHRRYFVVADATYRRRLEGPDERGLVTAWVEWEAATECTPLRGSRGAGEPRWLHRPLDPAESPPTERIPQNTDPLVFGDRFLTTFCRQNGSRQIHSLQPGSVLVFGSRIHGHFVLDTVLVVQRAISHDRNTWRERITGHLDGLATELTLRPMYAWPGSRSYTALVGATPNDPVNGMFSFVPCLPAEHGGPRGFARPSLGGIPGVNPNNWRALSFNHEIGPNEISVLWHTLADRVLDKGLALATTLAPPPLGKQQRRALNGEKRTSATSTQVSAPARLDPGHRDHPREQTQRG